MAKKKKKVTKKVAKKVTKKAATPAGPTPQPERRSDHRWKISEKDVGSYGKALQEAGFVYVDEVVGTNADVLEGKVKGWDRKTASDAKRACYLALNPQGAPPPGSYPQP